MTEAFGAMARAARVRTGMRNVCAAGVAAAVVAAGLGTVPPRETPVSRVMHLEAALAASVISTVASISEPTPSNSTVPERNQNPSAAATSDYSLSLPQALLFTAAAALATPAWYIAFPATITLSTAFMVILLAPFVAAAGGTLTPTLALLMVPVGVAIYALLPPAAILGGLVNIWQGLTGDAGAQPAAAVKAKSAVRSGDEPSATGRSARGVAGPRSQSNTAARSTAKASSNKNQSRASSKKSTTSKRAVGGSGRNR